MQRQDNDIDGVNALTPLKAAFPLHGVAVVPAGTHATMQYQLRRASVRLHASRE